MKKKTVMIMCALFTMLTSIVSCSGKAQRSADTIPADTLQASLIIADSTPPNDNVMKLHAVNDSLYQKIYTSLSKPILTLLHREQVLNDSLLTAKLDFAKLYMCDCGRDFANKALSDIETEFLNNSIDNLKDFLYSLNDASYALKRVYKPILQLHFNKAYGNFKSNLSLHSGLSKVLNQTEIKLDNERKAWNELMQLRSGISELLQNTQKQVFDNGTYRLQWYQLIQLKNEYMGYGMIEREVDDCMLHDTCSYQEVLEYEGFTLVSEEYYRRRFHSSYIQGLQSE